YDFTVENIGSGTDDFTLEYQGIWPATIYDDTWTPRTGTGPMSTGEIISFHLNVSIPGTAVGALDDTLIWSNSTLDPPECTYASILTRTPYETPYYWDATAWDDWTTSTGALWHLEGSRSNSPPTSCAFNDGVDYDTGQREAGSLYSPWIDLPAGRSYAEFSWWEWRETEDWGSPYDGSFVYISTDGKTWDMLYANYLSITTWTKRTYDISAYIGNIVKFRFFFDSRDTTDNAYEGWFVDDVRILSPEVSFTPPAQSAFADPGDTVTYSESIMNEGENTDSFDLAISSVLGWPATIYDTTWTPIVNTGPIDPGNSMDLYVNVSVPGAALTSDTEITTITATSTSTPTLFVDCPLTTFVRDDILVVDDDGAIEPDTGTYYTNALTALGYGYDLLEVATMGKPDLAGLQAHTITIWFCGENGGAWLGNDEPLTAIDRSNIATYLNGGGKMFWSSGGSSGAASLGSWKDWVNSYFFGDLTSGGYTGAAGNVITGRAGNPIGDGLTFDLYTGVDGWVSPTGMGGLINRGNEGTLPSMTCFDSSFGSNSGFNGQSGDFRTVYFAWDYAGIDGAATRNTVMQRILDYIDPDVGVQLTPPADRLEFGPAGTDVAYDLNIKNMGKNPDSFDLTAAGAWTVTFYDTAWNPIINTGLLNPTESINIYINVSIPGAAAGGDSDTSVVTVTSTVDSGVDDSVTMITYHPFYPLYNYPATIVDGWTTSSTSPLCTWHLEGSRFNSTPTSWAYNNGVDCDLGEGVKHGGNLYSPWISLPAGSIRAEFSWWEWRETKNTVVDISRVFISTDGETWDQFYEDPYIVDEWTKRTYDISAYIGNVVKFRFFFYSQGWYDDYEGWYVDDIQVWCPEYGLEWWTPRQPAFGDPGDIKSYDMILQNIGRYTDTFAFTTTLGWPVTVYDDTWTVVADSGAMDPGTIKQFHANVTIPPAALTSDTETTIITATSTLDPAYTADETLTTFVRDPVLLVSDDFEKGIETFYMDALDNNSFGGFYSYDWFDTYTLGTPSLETLQAHDLVIWHTVGVGTELGAPWDPRNPLDADERFVIGKYLVAGGRMFLSSSMAIAAYFNGYATWGIGHFGMRGEYWWPSPSGSSASIYGVTGNPIGDGLALDYHMGDGHPDCLGEATAGSTMGAFNTAFVQKESVTVGTTLDNGIDRRVLLSFDFADISGVDNRNELMRRILTWLFPPPYCVNIFPSQCQYGFAGESVSYDLIVKNIGMNPDIYDITTTSAPSGWTVSLYEADGVTPLADNGGAPGVPDTNWLAPGDSYNIVARVQVDALASPGDFDVAEIRADCFSAPPTHATATLDTRVPHHILLVDDDDSLNNLGPYYAGFYSVEDPTDGTGTPYADTLTALGYQFDLYVVPSGENGPDLETLLCHRVVIWICGYEWGYKPPLSGTDQNNLATYFDNGGKLWLNGPLLLIDLNGWGGPRKTYEGSFLYDYLKISDTCIFDIWPPDPLLGCPGSIFEGTSYTTQSTWPHPWTGEVDVLPLPDSLGGFYGPMGNLPYSAHTYEDYEGGYQVCYLGFEFAFIKNAADKQDCAMRILDWFISPVGVSICPGSQNWYGTPASYVWYNLTVKNRGLDSDSFDMSYVSPLGWTYDLFESDMVTPLVDTNGNLVPDTGDLPTRPTIIEVVNETVYGPAVGGEMGPIW
ncbi:MAG: hypothetical protein KAX31_01615, partial [Thermoplasmata archaeon]|nr:hypothetical protein [Thermoplasmata archaeon]